MKRSGFLVAVLLAVFSCKPGTDHFYLASDCPSVPVMGPDGVVLKTLPRGSEVQPGKPRKIKMDGKSLRLVPIGKGCFVSPDRIVRDFRETVRETTLYAQCPVSVISDTVSCTVCGLVEKNGTVGVLGFDRIRPDGTVVRYHTDKGFVYGQYFAREPAGEFGSVEFREAHAKVRNPFKGGVASGCEFRPFPKYVEPKRQMPDTCRGIYLNISAVGRIDEYLRIAKGTRLNTFVIDVKDDTCPGFKAEAMRKHSPTTYAKARKNAEAMYEYAVKRIHEEGMWAVARISCFKDSWLVRDNPDVAITELATGEPIFHNKAHWPSAFNRRVWQYNVELALEAVKKFGFDEINFDYVRFPDKMNSIDHLIDFHNVYSETKCQAIQRFVRYACDELHNAGAYVSIDVFGEAANSGYVTAYGQYWPALSNIADVMCGMPYPDHFPAGYKGIDKPWNNPYETLSAWGRDVSARQAVTPLPAKTRTWIQAYHVMKHVDKEGIDYDAANMLREVAGLGDSGIGGGGYVAWLASSSVSGYESKMGAFK